MSNDIEYPDTATLGGFSSVNFKEHLPLGKNAVFAQACEIRAKQISYLISKTIAEDKSGLSVEDLAIAHIEKKLDVISGNLSQNQYYAIFGAYYSPVNLALSQEKLYAFDRVREFINIHPQDKGISDIALHKQLHRPPSTTPLPEELVKQYTEKYNEEQKQREIMGFPTANEVYGDVVAVTFSYESEQDKVALDEEYNNTIIDIFELFRVSQFEILNRWEKKAVIWQLRNVYTDPSHINPDDIKKNTIADMFEANVIMLLRHHETFAHTEKEFGTNSSCAMIDDNIMAAFFENAQMYLQYSFEEEAKKPFADMFAKNDTRFHKKFSSDEYHRYTAAIPENEWRYGIMDIGEHVEYAYKTPSFSSKHFLRLMNNAQENFDNFLNKEMARIAAENNLAPPPPADYFRQKSLKYDMYL